MKALRHLPKPVSPPSLPRSQPAPHVPHPREPLAMPRRVVVRKPHDLQAGRAAPVGAKSPILVRHEGTAPRERSTCGWRHRLISREDQRSGVAAWAHVVDIEGAKPHYHRRGVELYYVLEGDGSVTLDGIEHVVRKGSLVHIPPGVVHGAKGRMRILVVGIPDIAEDDLFFP